MKEKQLLEKYEELKNYMKPLAKEGICVAFSGGVDSSLILKAATDAGKEVGKTVYAVTFQTKLHPQAEIREASSLALSLGASHHIIKVDEFQDEVLVTNPVDRCYRCKKLLFTELFQFAKEHDCPNVMEGSNADDLTMYRPGSKAVREMGAYSPLQEFTLHKEEIRAICKLFGVESSNKPSAPCLATRLPYGAAFDFALLSRIAEAEEFIKKIGFYNVRVRFHDPIARIETDLDQLSKLLSYREEIIEELKRLGFVYVTLDLEGFSSGSMDVNIEK